MNVKENLSEAKNQHGFCSQRRCQHSGPNLEMNIFRNASQCTVKICRLQFYK